MTTTPSGRPAWARTVTHEDYGGNTGKRNYQSQGVVNPKTDVGAEGFARMVADAEATTRTAVALTLRIRCNDAAPDAPTVLSAYMMVGVSTAGYEGDVAPDDFPAGARNGTGHVTFTLEDDWADAYGSDETFTPTQCLVSAEGTTCTEVTYVISGNTIAFRCWDAAGSAVGDKTFTATIW